MSRPAQGTETPLTFLQSRFVDEIVANPDVTAKAAYIRAGFAGKAAETNGPALLRNPKIKAEIEKRRKSQLESAGVTKERVLQELISLAFTNLSDIVKQDEDGNTYVSLNEIPADKSGALTGLKIETSKGKTTIRKVDIKIADKLQALALLGKHLGMFKEDVNVKIQSSWSDLVEQAMQTRETLQIASQSPHSQVEDLSAPSTRAMEPLLRLPAPEQVQDA